MVEGEREPAGMACEGFRVGPLLNETKCHLVSFSLLLNETKWHLVSSSPN